MEKVQVRTGKKSPFVISQIARSRQHSIDRLENASIKEKINDASEEPSIDSPSTSSKSSVTTKSIQSSSAREKDTPFSMISIEVKQHVI